MKDKLKAAKLLLLDTPFARDIKQDGRLMAAAKRHQLAPLVAP